MPSMSQEEIPRLLVLAEVVSVGCLSLVTAYVRHTQTFFHPTDTLFLATLLLALVCVGFVMNLLRRWSTRLLWEWIFVSATLLGGWILPRTLISGGGGSVVAVLVLLAPLVSQLWWVRMGVAMIGAAGGAVLFASYIPTTPLWVLWAGLACYDYVAVRMLENTEAVLRALEARRSVLTRLPTIDAAHARILLSHIVLPCALIFQAGLRAPREGLILLGALLIGAWYAMMRPKESRPVMIVPWGAIWMVGASVLLANVRR